VLSWRNALALGAGDGRGCYLLSRLDARALGTGDGHRRDDEGLSWPETLALSLSKGSGANGLSRRGQLEALVMGAGAMAVWPCLASAEELAGG